MQVVLCTVGHFLTMLEIYAVTRSFFRHDFSGFERGQSANNGAKRQLSPRRLGLRVQLEPLRKRRHDPQVVFQRQDHIPVDTSLQAQGP